MKSVELGSFRSNEDAERAVLDVLRSGRLTYGPVSVAFEKEFARIHGCDYAIVTNSGTSSLLVALQAAKELRGWKDGSEVIVPATTFVATVNVVLHARLTPVLVDVDPETYCIDPDKISAAITHKTVAILPVHAFGLPADMLPIMDIAGVHSLFLLEDSCESMFVSTNDVSVGAWGDAAAFSTYAAHIIVTGVGGITTVREDEDLARKIRSLVNHGIDLESLPVGTPYETSWLGRHFLFTSVGHSFRITEMEAALGFEQLGRWNWILDARTMVANRLRKILSQYQLQLPFVPERADHAWMVFPIVRLDGPAEPLMRFLRQRGIQCRTMLPLTNQPCYRFREEDFPIAKWINERGFYIGCHQDMTEDDLAQVADAFAEFYSPF